MIFNNVEELNVQSEMSVIPAHTLSFAENALYIAEAIEADYNKLFEQVGIDELAVYEATGSVVVYEGTKLSDIKDKIVNFFKQMWAKIKAGFEAMLLKFESMRKDTMKNLPGLNKQVLDKLPADKKFGKTHNFVDLDAAKYFDRVDKYIDKTRNKFEAHLGSSFEASREDIKDTKEMLLDDLVPEISGTDAKSVNEMNKAIRAKHMGDEVEVDMEYMKRNFEDFVLVVIEGSTKKDIKAMYKDTKQMIDLFISDAKKLDDKRLGIFNDEVIVYKQIATCANAISNVLCDVSKRRYVEYRNILLRAYVANGRSTDVKESASVIATQRELIESAFDF